MKIAFGPNFNFNTVKLKKPVRIYKAPPDLSSSRLKKQALITSIVLVILILFISFFVLLTPLNIQDPSLWVTAIFRSAPLPCLWLYM